MSAAQYTASPLGARLLRNATTVPRTSYTLIGLRYTVKQRALEASLLVTQLTWIWVPQRNGSGRCHTIPHRFLVYAFPPNLYLQNKSRGVTNGRAPPPTRCNSPASKLNLPNVRKGQRMFGVRCSRSGWPRHPLMATQNFHRSGTGKSLNFVH